MSNVSLTRAAWVCTSAALFVVGAYLLATSVSRWLDTATDVSEASPLPDFAAIDDVKAKKSLFFSYLQPFVDKRNQELVELR